MSASEDLVRAADEAAKAAHEAEVAAYTVDTTSDQQPVGLAIGHYDAAITTYAAYTVAASAALDAVRAAREAAVPKRPSTITLGEIVSISEEEWKRVRSVKFRRQRDQALRSIQAAEEAPITTANHALKAIHRVRDAALAYCASLTLADGTAVGDTFRNYLVARDEAHNAAVVARDAHAKSSWLDLQARQ